MLSGRKGLTPVVASIVLCGVVLIIGTSVWSLTYSISNAVQDSYYEGVKKQIDTISERFTVEYTAWDNSAQALLVWVYNYGNVDIEVDVYVSGDAEGANSTATPVIRGEIRMIQVLLTASEGYELSITVMSRRQNFAYATYVVSFAEG